MPVTKDEAVRIAIEHLMTRIDVNSILEGWPKDAYRVSDDPVWVVPVPGDGHSVGSARYIVISQLTGKVLMDAKLGE